ncbi:MAG: phosphodiester glycosidase family protein [Sedimentitalea sp.]
MIRALLALLAVAFALPAHAADPAVECRNVDYQNTSYSVCAVDMTRADMRLFLFDINGNPFGHFSAIDQDLAAQNRRLVFGMNAGMYHDNRDPVGHYVEEGAELMRVVPNAGPGNFGLLPNGIFCIRAQRADVFETLSFVAAAPRCTHATQSGPMLVIDGKLHPRFLANSTSRYVRNGVGTSADGKTALFVISRTAVNFHTFASLFRDALGVPNALYFDGNVSRLHAPQLGRSDSGRRMGPVVGVVVPLNTP